METDPSHGKAYFHYSSYLARMQDHAKALQVLKDGAEKARYPADKVDIWNQIGTIMHDAKQWEQALNAHQQALSQANNAWPPVPTLPTITNIVFLSAFLTNWDEEAAMRPAMFDLIERELRGSPVPAVHPWMSICMPMHPSLRQKIATAFWTALQGYTIQRLGTELKPSIPTKRKLQREFKDWTSQLQEQTVLKSNMHHSSSESVLLVGDTRVATLPRKLRVGFASADFRTKATLYLARHTFDFLDRSVLSFLPFCPALLLPLLSCCALAHAHALPLALTLWPSPSASLLPWFSDPLGTASRPSLTRRLPTIAPS